MTSYIYKLFPPGENLVCDIPAEDGNIEKLFLQCRKRAVVPARQAGGIDSLEAIPGLLKSLKIPSLSFTDYTH
jgi:hypothetical protein